MRIVSSYSLERFEHPVVIEMRHGEAANPVGVQLLHAGQEVQQEELQPQDGVVPQGHGPALPGAPPGVQGPGSTVTDISGTLGM